MIFTGHTYTIKGTDANYRLRERDGLCMVRVYHSDDSVTEGEGINWRTAARDAAVQMRLEKRELRRCIRAVRRLRWKLFFGWLLRRKTVV